jgi:hypothetical protein
MWSPSGAVWRIAHGPSLRKLDMSCALLTYKLNTINLGDTAVSSRVEFRVGFRTVDSTFDVTLGGRVFSVNRQRVYLEGGNFIALDQFSRFNLDRNRYI